MLEISLMFAVIIIVLLAYIVNLVRRILDSLQSLDHIVGILGEVGGDKFNRIQHALVNVNFALEDIRKELKAKNDLAARRFAISDSDKASESLR